MFKEDIDIPVGRTTTSGISPGTGGAPGSPGEGKWTVRGKVGVFGPVINPKNN